MRSTFTACGTSPSMISDASVPPQKNTKVKAPSYPTASAISGVRVKSSSVSPGKPTMMSVVRATSGTCSRMRATRSRYRSRV